MYLSARRSKRLLLDTCVFLHYLSGDELADKAEILVKLAVEGKVVLAVSSEAYDDAITALRSKGVKTSVVLDMLKKWASIPHQVLPLTIEAAIEALRLYNLYGGRRRLHYFDAFHVATAKYYDLPLVTSDKYIITHSEALGIDVINLRKISYNSF